MNKTVTVLVVNPGSTSTKTSIFKNEEEELTFTLKHSAEDLRPFRLIYDQFQYRLNMLYEALEERNVDLSSIDAVVGRGGMMRPVIGGTYRVNEAMKEDLKTGFSGQHASSLGGLIADAIASRLGIDAYVVDPTIVDEMEPLARISGMPDIQRSPKDHPLNQKAAARRAAEELGGDYEDFNFIVAHLGGGVSAGAHKKGRMIDVNNCLDGDGPMSPERSGGVPFGPLVDMCFSGKYTRDQILRKMIGGGGLTGYLGTNNGLEIENRVKAGDEKARLAYEAMAYQISKEIGACATVLMGKVDAIVLTGGLARDKMLTDWITERTSFIAPIKIYPGEFEMQALTQGVLRVLSGKEQAKTYPNESQE